MKNQKIFVGVGLVIGVVVIVWVSFTYRFQNFPLQWDREACGDEGDGTCTSWVSEWIVSFANQEKHSNAQVCFNTLPGPRSFERIYAISPGSPGFSAGGMYFDKEGQFITSETVDDTGRLYSGGIYVGNILDENPPALWGSTLDMCTSVPEWFFNIKVDRNTAK